MVYEGKVAKIVADDENVIATLKYSIVVWRKHIEIKK